MSDTQRLFECRPASTGRYYSSSSVGYVSHLLCSLRWGFDLLKLLNQRWWPSCTCPSKHYMQVLSSRSCFAACSVTNGPTSQTVGDLPVQPQGQYSSLTLPLVQICPQAPESPLPTCSPSSFCGFCRFPSPSSTLAKPPSYSK